MDEQELPPAYTFDEFADHMEHVTKLLASDRVPGEYQFERSVMRSIEYFKPLYLDDRERTFKIGRFCLMMHFIAAHINDFDRGDFAVFGSERVGALVSNHLLRAVHHVFTTRDICEMTNDPTPEEIMALAEKFREQEEQPAQLPSA